MKLQQKNVNQTTEHVSVVTLNYWRTLTASVISELIDQGHKEAPVNTELSTHVIHSHEI